MKDLEEAAAFARGADFLSEAFVFFVGGASPVVPSIYHYLRAPQTASGGSILSHILLIRSGMSHRPHYSHPPPYAGAILTFEYTRSNMSAARKEAEKERGRQQFREVCG